MAAEGPGDPEISLPEDRETEDRKSGDLEPGTGIPWVPLFLYLAAVLFYLMHATAGDLYAELPATKAWLFAPVFLYLAVGGLATGRAPLRARPVSRETHPKVFWLVIGLYFALALAMIALGFDPFGPAVDPAP